MTWWSVNASNICFAFKMKKYISVIRAKAHVQVSDYISCILTILQPVSLLLLSMMLKFLQAADIVTYLS